MSPTLEADPTARLPLTVSTSDPQSEIVVLDARGRLVQRALGPSHTFSLVPGIYRVKVLAGAEFLEKSIVLTETPRDPMRFEQVAFASPAPLAGTSASHEYHMEAANRESQVTHVFDGLGSSLFFLVRDWTPTAAESPRQRVTTHPAEGLSLYAVSVLGERKVCDLAVSGTRSAAWSDPWAACTIEVVPGVYELRLELPGGETLHQSFVASPDWQTQSFVFMRAYPSDAGPQWRADLSRTSVLLSQTRGFSPNDSILRVAELARMALATKRPGGRGQTDRPLMPAETRALLREKFANPFLGIYGAHLLLRERSVDVDLLRDVVRNLRAMLGRHPDVEALALSVAGEPLPLPFERPPMLRRSWSLVVDASVTQPGLVTESLAERNTGKFWAEGSWHIWRSSANAGNTDGDPDALGLSDVEAALAEDLGVMKHVRRMSRTGSTTESARASRDTTAPEGLSPQEAFADGFAAAAPEIDDAPGISVGHRLRNPAPSEDVEVEIDAARLRSIVTRFGMPSTQVKRMLTALEDKLARSPDAPNLKVVLK